MDRPQGHLDAEADDEEGRDEHLGRGGQPGAVGGGEQAQVGGPALDDEDEDAEEHQRRPEGREEDEPVGRVGPGPLGGVVVPEPADEHPHRDEHDLERDEEEDRVASEEGGESTELDEQEARVVGRGRVAAARPDGAAGSTGLASAGVDHDRDAEGRGEQGEGDGHAVDREVPAQPERRDPRGVDLRTQDDGHEREQEGHDAGDEGEPASRARRIPAPGGEQPDRDDGGDDEGQGQCHTVTPATAMRTTPTTTASSPAEGAARWAFSPSRPAIPVRDAAPRG